MPDYKRQNGTTTAIPGLAEIIEKVILSGAGPTPTFAVPVILGDAPYGYPYNYDTAKLSSESAAGPFRSMSSTSIVHSTFGTGGDIPTAFRNAQARGLPMAFVACVAPLVRAKVVATSSGPVNETTFFNKLFGAPGGHTMIKWASGILTITPVKAFAMLSVAVATTDVRIFVAGQDEYYSPIAWMSPGMTVYLGDNDTANFAVVVDSVGRELDSSGQWKYYFNITAAAGTAVEISTKYGCVTAYDDATEVSPTFTTGQGQKLVDWVNQYSQYLGAQVESTFTGALPLTVATSTAIKDMGATWGAVTVGTSPASATGDWNTFFTAYQATYYDDFRSRFGLRPRLHLMLSSNSTVHGYARSFVRNMRGAIKPSEFLSGALYTDTVLTASDDTNPTYRTQNINDQDIALFVGKFERLAPYLSLAAYAFGILAQGSRQTITRQRISPNGSPFVGRLWDQQNTSELDTIIKGGGITYMLSSGETPEWQFTAGVNTLQDRVTTWSPSVNKTCLIQSRNCVDEYLSGLGAILDSFVGDVSADQADVGQAIDTYNRAARDQRGLIVDFGPPSISFDSATALWRVTDLDIDPVVEGLFVALTVNINIGS